MKQPEDQRSTLARRNQSHWLKFREDMNEEETGRSRCSAVALIGQGIKPLQRDQLG